MERQRPVDSVTPFVLSLAAAFGGWLFPFAFLLGIVSLVLARKGLRRIAAGEADTTGQPLLQSALVLSWAALIIGTLLFIAAAAIQVFLLNKMMPLIQQLSGGG